MKVSGRGTESEKPMSWKDLGCFRNRKKVGGWNQDHGSGRGIYVPIATGTQGPQTPCFLA